MGKLLRYLTIGVIIFTFAITLSNCSQKSFSPLRIGINTWPGYEILYLAKNLGYYDNTGIKLVDYPSATELARAYRHHDIEGAGFSLDQTLQLASIQENIKIITIVDISHGGDVILGKPNIKTMKDLKGKKVGVESTALGAFVITRALEKNGMSPQDIEIISLELSEHENAYRQGSVDAVVTFDPPRSILLDIGANLLFDSTQISGEIVDVLAVNQNVIANSADTIQILVNGYFRALDYFQKNPESSAIIMAKRTQVTPEKMLKSFEDLILPNLAKNKRLLNQNDPLFLNSIEKLIKIMIGNNLLQKPVNPWNIIDDRFVQNVH